LGASGWILSPSNPGLRSSPTRTDPHPRSPSVYGPLKALTCATRDAYRFTVKFLALLLPAKVATVTLTLPYFAFVGTLHVICVGLHET